MASRAMVLTDGMLNFILKKSDPHFSCIHDQPTTTIEKGCGCKGKKKKLVEVPDYNGMRQCLISNRAQATALKQHLNVDSLVIFLKTNGKTERKVI